MFDHAKLHLWNLLGSVILVCCGCGPSNAVVEDRASYFGIQAQEYTYSYEAQIRIPKSKGMPNESALATEVRLSSKYTLGRMHLHGSIYPDFATSIQKIEEDAQSPNAYLVTYTVAGRAVFVSNKIEYNFFVPIAPREIYATATPHKCHRKDPELIDEGNFWYHWDPEIPECNLKLNIDYLKINARLTAVNQTSRETYPEYDSLVRQNQITMTLFYGYDETTVVDGNALTSSDSGAKAYRKMKSLLEKELKFTSALYAEEEMRQIFQPTVDAPLPFGEIYTKDTQKGRLRIRTFFLETKFKEKRASAFHHFLRDALKNDSVISYDGHSGIGRTLNLSAIEKQIGLTIEMNSGYQIVFLGSCLPYAYYTKMLFDRKKSVDDIKGTKKLDILAYALESSFGNEEFFRMIRGIDGFMKYGFRLSYQDIVNEYAKDYFGVIGDEDNTENK